MHDDERGHEILNENDKGDLWGQHQRRFNNKARQANVSTIDKKEIELIKQNLPWDKILSFGGYAKFNTFKVSGDEITCSSPFREDSKPSFAMNTAKHVCIDRADPNNWGDKFSLLATFMGLIPMPCADLVGAAFIETKKKAAELAGVELKPRPQTPQHQDEPKKPPGINFFAGIEALLASSEESYVSYMGGLYRYKDGKYVSNENKTEYKRIAELYAKYIGTPPKNPDQIETFIKLLSKMTTLPTTITPVFLTDPEKQANVINFKNGYIDVNELLATKSIKLHEPTPNLFTLNRLDFDYDPNAQCPEWDHLLDKILPRTGQGLYDQDTLHEILGYCMTPMTSFDKFFVFVGDGANGKSVITTVFKEILGKGNYSSLPWDALHGQGHVKTELVGKTCNIQEDAPDITKAIEGEIKNATSGGVITINPKFKPAYNYTLTAKWLQCCNEMPTFKDPTRASIRRMKVIEFKQTIPENEQRKELRSPEFWTKSGELPGITNKILAGLLTLLERTNFYTSEEEKALVEEHFDMKQPVRSFLKECTIKTPGAVTTTADLFGAFVEFIGEVKEWQCSKNMFARQIKASTGLKAEVTRFPGIANTKKAYIGISLNPDGQDLLNRYNIKREKQIN